MRKSLIPWRKERTPAAVARREEEQPFLDLHRRMNDLFDSFFEDFDRGIGRPWAAS
jgi:HSP20 family protein